MRTGTLRGETRRNFGPRRLLRRPMVSQRRVVGIAAGLALAAAAAFGVTASQGAGGSATHTAAQPRPNVVFVLTDDLAWNLVRFMPHVQALQRRGTTFSRYFVTDSLCCPSRSSIFTGRFPHSTGIFTNMGADGGFRAFRTT